MFKVLDLALVLLSRLSRIKRAEITSFAGFWVFFAGIKAVLPGL